MSDDGWGDACIECFHTPAVHGITYERYCTCCENPLYVAAARDQENPND